MLHADGVCSHHLPTHLHSVNADVPRFSPVALYAKLQKPKGSGDPVLQRNHSKKQRYPWRVKCESRLRESSSASPAPAAGPAPALVEAAASPSFPSPTQVAKDPQTPGLGERGGQLWKPEARPCRGGASPAAGARCWASSLPPPAWGLQPGSSGDPGGWGPARPLFRFCRPAGCHSPSRSHQRFSRPGSGPCPGRDRPHSFCK